MPTDEIRNELTRAVSGTRSRDGAGDWMVGRPPVESAVESSAEALTREIAALTRQVTGLRESVERPARAEASPATAARDGLERANDIVKAVRGPARLGAAATPLAALFRGLFGKREAEPPPALPVFEMPESVSIDGAFSRREGGRVEPMQRDASGTARAVPSITINVQAMDSRSFLDHSDSIARAVREAMLNTHSLNDVVNEL